MFNLLRIEHNKRNLSKISGQSLVELIIGIGIASIVLGSVVGAVILSVRINKQSITSGVASGLAQELLDDVRSYSGGSWARLYGVDVKGATSTYYMMSSDSIVFADIAGNIGCTNSLQLDAFGYPVVSYYNNNYIHQDLKILHCNDVNCAGGNESIVSVDTAGVGEYNSLQLDASGYPVVSYYDEINYDLKILHCNDVNCSGGDESIVSVDTVGDVGRYNSLQLDASGYPVVSYYNNINEDLKILHCNDANCAGGNESIVSVDTRRDVGLFNSLQLDASRSEERRVGKECRSRW